MNSLENSQINMLVAQLKMTDRYKDTDLSRPLLILLPTLEAKQKKNTVLLQEDEVADFTSICNGIKELEKNSITRFQAAFLFPDKSVNYTGSYLLNNSRISGDSMGKFGSFMRDQGKIALTSLSAKGFESAVRSAPRKKKQFTF